MQVVIARNSRPSHSSLTGSLMWYGARPRSPEGWGRPQGHPQNTLHTKRCTQTEWPLQRGIGDGPFGDGDFPCAESVYDHQGIATGADHVRDDSHSIRDLKAKNLPTSTGVNAPHVPGEYVK